MLKEQFGGSVTLDKRENSIQFVWQATSDESLLRLKKAIEFFKFGMPSSSRKMLLSFINSFI